MLLVVHIIFALSSIPLMLAAVVAKYFEKGYEKNLAIASSVGLFGLLVSGTILVIANHLAITGACLEGTIYVAIFGAALALYRKTAKSRV